MFKRNGWQEIGTLNDAALTFSDIYNMGPEDIDEMGGPYSTEPCHVPCTRVA